MLLGSYRIIKTTEWCSEWGLVLPFLEFFYLPEKEGQGKYSCLFKIPSKNKDMYSDTRTKRLSLPDINIGSGSSETHTQRGKNKLDKS